MEVRLTNIEAGSRVAVWVEPMPTGTSKRYVREHQPVLTTDPIINTLSEDPGGEFNFTVPGLGWNQHFIMFRVRNYGWCPIQMNLSAEDIIDQRHVIHIPQVRDFYEDSKPKKTLRRIIGPYGTPFTWWE